MAAVAKGINKFRMNLSSHSIKDKEERARREKADEMTKIMGKIDKVVHENAMEMLQGRVPQTDEQKRIFEV